MINYPEKFDNQTNLLEAHDSLQVILANNYYPGQNFIITEGDNSLFPPTGIISLTDQCNDIKTTSFYYKKKTNNGFFELEILSSSKDSFKPKRKTIVTQQVMAEYHNFIKDALINIETFLGTQKNVDKSPFGDTLFGRINFLRNLLFTPKAWFEADKTIGIVPFAITFTGKSTGTALTYFWDFGDGTQIITADPLAGKTFQSPGTFDITLTVENSFGKDTITFPKMVQARIEAPKEAIINFNKQKTLINQNIDIEIAEGENLNYPGTTYAGELINLETKMPFDPIIAYTWSLGDDLIHNNSKKTTAIYRMGGLYDLTLRVDTKFGAYRITTYENAINITERTNLWLWTKRYNSLEFGLMSETFKTNNNICNININDSFVSEKSEFWQNNGFAVKGETGLLFWASGRNSYESSLTETIEFTEYNGFLDTYTSCPAINRSWNWIGLVSPNSIYFILGTVNKPFLGTSPTNQAKTTLNLNNLVISNNEMRRDNYLSGANELMWNTVEFDEVGEPIGGHFSSYRSSWRDYVGYILKDGNKFYKTDGILSNPFINIVKLVDMPAQKNGNLVSLSSGVFFLNTSGAINAYKEASGTWETKSTVLGHGNGDLLTVSDNEHCAYLCFNDVFLKFNEIDLTFTNIGHKPIDKYWLMGIF